MDDRNAVYSLRSAIAFARRSRGIELVQMEETFGWAARLVGQIDVPMVVRVAGPTLLHGVVRNNRGASSMQRSDLELQGIRDAAGVVFQSHAFKARVCAALGGSLRKCTVIPNPAPNYSQAETWTRHTAEFGRVLFVGRFDRHKGGDLVIDAWSRVAASTPCSRLVIIGPDRGFHNEQGRGWSIGEYIADHVPAALQDRIEYLGSQPPAVIEVERRRASLVVMASRIENFSNTLLEAMAMGCPVIASDSGGTPEIVGRDGAGVLFQSGNSTAFADAMEQCLADPDRAAAMGTEARRRCVERFSLPKVAEMYAAFYREVLGTRE
jgi:glycosyltransferase involved in cell wall biosynthesis